MNIVDGQPDRHLTPEIKDTKPYRKALKRSAPHTLRFSGLWCHVEIKRTYPRSFARCLGATEQNGHLPLMLRGKTFSTGSLFYSAWCSHPIESSSWHCAHLSQTTVANRLTMTHYVVAG